MATIQSQNVKNGGQLNLAAASTPIAAGNLVEIGGVGNAAWAAGTIDYAAISAKGEIKALSAIDASAIPLSSHYMPAARDRFGNIYVVGTNSSARLVVYKFSAKGDVLANKVLDSSAAGVYNPELLQLSNGTFVCIYGRSAATGLRYIIFDSFLTQINANAIATISSQTNAFQSSCVLSGGGFAVLYQNGAGTSLILATYSNTGSLLTSTTAQGFTSTVAAISPAIRQLSSGNLICAFRSTMLAGGTAGTGFVIVTTAGGAVAGPTNVDPTSTLGLVSLDVLTGFFAISAGNGTNLIAAAYSNAGAIQGSVFSTGNTVNEAKNRCLKILNDGVKFFVVYASSAANGIYLFSLSTSGAVGGSVSNLGSADFDNTQICFDATMSNGQIVLTGTASSAFSNYWMTIAYGDPNLGIVYSFIRNPVTSFGTGNINTLNPRVLSGAGGLYDGTSLPPDQPTGLSQNGDFVGIFIIGRTASASTEFAIEKFEDSAIVGLALTDKVAGGDTVLVNPGPGSYPLLALGGTQGTSFDHTAATPQGSSGILYNKGAAFNGLFGS